MLTGNGGTVHINSTGYIETGADCDLEEEPEVTYSKGIENRVRTIKCFDASHTIAGVDDDSDFLEALAAIQTLSEATSIIEGLF